MLRLSADLPDAAVRLAPVFEGMLDLLAGDLPDPFVEPVARPGVQVDRFEHGPPYVVLLLLVGGVPDPHRARVLVSLQVVEHPFGEIRGAVDAVDDLQVAAVTFGQVRDEGEVVVGLPVEAQGVQAPEREGGITDPAVAVVPVPLPARGFWQGCGGRRGDGAGRGERQALERQRAPGEVAAPAVVGEVAPGQPVLPVMRRPSQALVGLLVALRRGLAAPGQRAEAGVALAQQGPARGRSILRSRTGCPR